MVIRVSRSGNVGNSAPCIHCLRNMTYLPHKKGYHINTVYYSDSYGNIQSQRLDELIASEFQHMTSFHRNNKIDVRKILKWRKKYLS